MASSRWSGGGGSSTSRYSALSCTGFNVMLMIDAGDDVVLEPGTRRAMDVEGCALDCGGEATNHPDQRKAGGVGCDSTAIFGCGDHLKKTVF